MSDPEVERLKSVLFLLTRKRSAIVAALDEVDAGIQSALNQIDARGSAVRTPSGDQ
jgi:hypothetical protein